MFKLEIKTDNAAFEENRGWEIQCILDSVISKIDNDKLEGKCIDSNGNIVGQWSLTED